MEQRAKEKAIELVEKFGEKLAPKVVDEILCICHDYMAEFYIDVAFVILSINSGNIDVATKEKLIEANDKFNHKNNKKRHLQRNEYPKIPNLWW